MELRRLLVNIAQSQLIDRFNGESALSGIGQQPVFVLANLEGGGPSVREAFPAVFGPRAGTDRVRRVEDAAALSESRGKPVFKCLAGSSESR